MLEIQQIGPATLQTSRPVAPMVSIAASGLYHKHMHPSEAKADGFLFAVFTRHTDTLTHSVTAA